MDNEYEISDSYSELASPIIKEKRPDILDSGISIGFVSSMKKKTRGKTKLVLGECKKISELQKLFCPYDFLIIIYEQNCEGLNNEQMKILIWHELEHIGIDNKGEHFLKPHDVEDFDKIIDEHGLHWANDTIEIGDANG